MLRTLFILLVFCCPSFGANYLIYIPRDYRIQNIRASCVHASVCNCMKTANLWDKAEEHWQKYKGDFNGEGSGSISEKLTKGGVRHKIVHSEEMLIESLRAGRGAAVTCFGAHVVNLAGKINDEAYLVDNNDPTYYKILPWDSFMRNFKRSGNWAVIILDGKVHRPVIKSNLNNFKDIERAQR